MFDSETFRARAAQCRRKAENAKNESEKRTWAMLAQRWLELLDEELAKISSSSGRSSSFLSRKSEGAENEHPHGERSNTPSKN